MAELRRRRGRTAISILSYQIASHTPWPRYDTVAPRSEERVNRVIFAGILALLPVQALVDDGIGRYQALAIPETDRTGFAKRILFLDTRDGHVWEWRYAPTTSNTTAGGGFTYIGKLAPGEAPSAEAGTRAGPGKCFSFNGKQFCE
jgi:hypothetical protein